MVARRVPGARGSVRIHRPTSVPRPKVLRQAPPGNTMVTCDGIRKMPCFMDGCLDRLWIWQD